jgi:hypothetical protein
MCSPSGALHIEDLARHGHASIEKGNPAANNTLVNFDEEIERCVDLS